MILKHVRQLKKEVLLLSGQANKKARKRKVYYYEDVKLTDELLVEYIDTKAFTVYELEKIVSAKKNVFRPLFGNSPTFRLLPLLLYLSMESKTK